MVSIVVPVYNVAEYLPSCLDSLFGQELSESMEVILVDDGSTDSSPDICERYREEHPGVVVIHQFNKGLSEARNAGIKNAKGEWLYFLDGDDWLAPRALQTLIDYAERTSCDMVIGSFYYAYDSYLLYDDRWFKNSEPFVMNREEAMRALIHQRFFKNFAWGKLYRTEIVKMHPFRPGVYFEDSFWQHLIVDEIQSVGVVPKPLYYYRQRPDSISGVFSRKSLDLLDGNEERFKFILEHYPSLTADSARAFWSLCRQFKDRGNNIPEFRLFWEHIQKEYASVFSVAMKKDVYYQAVCHCPLVAKIMLFGRRCFNRLFARRPKVLPYAA